MDLLDHQRFGGRRLKCSRQLMPGMGLSFIRWGAADWDVAALFSPDEFVFLDLETTGLYGTSPCFLWV